MYDMTSDYEMELYDYLGNGIEANIHLERFANEGHGFGADTSILSGTWKAVCCLHDTGRVYMPRTNPPRTRCKQKTQPILRRSNSQVKMPFANVKCW